MNIKSGNQSTFIKKSKKLSRLQGKLKDLVSKRQEFLDIILENNLLVRGGVYIINRKCGKPACKCAFSSYRHASYYLYRSEEGDNQTIYIKADQVGRLRILTNNYKKFRQARAKLMIIEKKIVDVINKIEEHRSLDFFREGKNHGKRNSSKATE